MASLICTGVAGAVNGLSPGAEPGVVGKPVVEVPGAIAAAVLLFLSTARPSQWEAH